MALPTSKEIADLYLYGSSSIPDLTTESVIRENPLAASIPRNVDVKEYMSAGAGRFATGDQFALVSTFFAGSAFDHLEAGESLTKAEYAARIGLTSYGLNVYQRDVDDGAGDYGERVFIWNSLQYKISDAAVFKVNLDGTRVIENFGILPVTNDNFDFQSDDAGVANDILESWIDPWGIGRQVPLNFIGSVDLQVYDATDYAEDITVSQSWTHPSYTTLFESMAEIANDLWDGGDTRFVDQDNRVIQYGTLGTDTLHAEFEQDWLTTITENLLGSGAVGAGQLEAFEDFGFHIIAGGGDDNVFGGEAGDYLDTGSGDDIVFASGEAMIDDAANDLVFAGLGNDVVSVGGGSDVVSLGAGNDAVHLIMPPEGDGSPLVQSVVWGGEGADSFYFAHDAHVLSINVDGMTEDLLKNLGTSALFSVFNQGLEWPYDYILVNVEQQDKIFIEGTLLTTAGVVPQSEDHEVEFFNYSFDHRGADGWNYYVAHSITNSETVRQMDYYEMPGFEGPYSTSLDPTDKGLAARFGSFVLDGFADGMAGIHFVGDGISFQSETTTTVQQINVTNSDTRIFEPSTRSVYIVPLSYDLVGNPVTTTEFSEGYHLRPEGYESYTAPTVNLANFQFVEVNGTTDDDNFTGDARSQNFRGGQGNDTVDYSASPDGITVDLSHGGDGGNAAGDTFDSIENVSGTASDDELTGNAAGNVLVGDDGNDWLDGLGGDDTLLGGEGSENILDGYGNDIVFGGNGDDWIVADYGNDVIDGGEGTDTVSLWGADYTMFRTADNAVTMVSLFGGVDTLNDVEIIATYSGGVLERHNISDLVPVLPPANLLDGTAGDDILNGTVSNGIINGLDGDDTITAGSGSDIVNAGAGNDTIVGGPGNDIVNAGDGHDAVIFAGEFSDFNLTAVNDHTVLLQAAGINSIIRNAETITFDAPGNGTDHSVDVAAFLSEYAPRQINGTGGSDTLYGTTGHDEIYGNGGNDTIFTGAGDDYVEAGSGNDVIHAESGSDDLYGGTGTDTVIFDGPRSSYTLSVYDDITVQIDGPDSVTWIADGEWLIFDDPNSDVDEVINIDDFLGGGGSVEESTSGGGSAEESNVVAMNVNIATPAPSSANPAPSSAADTPSAEVISFPMLNVTARQGIEPTGIEDLNHNDAEDSGFGAAVNSLQDFTNTHQDGLAISDLWFEPEPIGLVI